MVAGEDFRSRQNAAGDGIIHGVNASFVFLIGMCILRYFLSFLMQISKYLLFFKVAYRAERMRL